MLYYSLKQPIEKIIFLGKKTFKRQQKRSLKSHIKIISRLRKKQKVILKKILTCILIDPPKKLAVLPPGICKME